MENAVWTSNLVPDTTKVVDWCKVKKVKVTVTLPSVYVKAREACARYRPRLWFGTSFSGVRVAESRRCRTNTKVYMFSSTDAYNEGTNLPL